MRVEEGVGIIGITNFAQSELGDIVFIEIETVGETLKKEDAFGTVEAVKTVSDLFMPVGGKVLEVNPELESLPALVNSDPYGRGWMIKVSIANPAELSELMTAEEYKSIAEA